MVSDAEKAKAADVILRTMENEKVRNCAWALGAIGYKKAKDSLQRQRMRCLELLEKEDNPLVRPRIQETLKAIEEALKNIGA